MEIGHNKLLHVKSLRLRWNMCEKVDPCDGIYIVNVKRFWTSRDGTRTHVEYLRHTQVPEKVEFLFKFQIFKCQVKILNEDFEIRFWEIIFIL